MRIQVTGTNGQKSSEPSPLACPMNEIVTKR
jgi:hypothetical protein